MIKQEALYAGKASSMTVVILRIKSEEEFSFWK
jgi:hypothetical protein